MAIHSNTGLRIPHRVLVATAAGLLVAFSTGTALLTRGQSITRVNTVFEGNSPGAPQSRRSRRVGSGIPGGVPVESEEAYPEEYRAALPVEYRAAFLEEYRAAFLEEYQNEHLRRPQECFTKTKLRVLSGAFL